MGRLILMCAMVAASGCVSAGRKSVPSQTWPLIVDNRSDFEVVVYAMPSPQAAGIRLGNARSFSKTTMAVPRNALQQSSVLVLRVHSIGSPPSVRPWTTPAEKLDPNMYAALEIRSDPSGNLSRSSFYTGQAGGPPP